MGDPSNQHEPGSTTHLPLYNFFGASTGSREIPIDGKFDVNRR